MKEPFLKAVSQIREIILPLLGKRIFEAIYPIGNEEIGRIEEIRLRAQRPLMVVMNDGDYFVEDKGVLNKKIVKPISVHREDIEKSVQLMCDYSLYASREDIRQGFITLTGGHRVGLSGKVVIDGGKITNIKYITGLNIRVAREIKGCSDIVIKNVFNKTIDHTLIVSPPGCGKTTLLRDIIRVLSNGDDKQNIKGFRVGLVDERSEIAASYLGVPQMDVGIRTDVLDGCPKVEGMMMLLRSMSPEIIAVDEIGSLEDCAAIEVAINTGVKILATAHGKDMEEILKRPGIKNLLSLGCFDKIIFLSRKMGPGTIEKIINVGEGT